MPVFLSVVKQLKKIMKPLVTEEEDGCYQCSSISLSRVSQLLAHLQLHIGTEPLLLASVVKTLGCLSSSGMKDDHIRESPQNAAINE